jgi:hypothetical protein
MGAVATLDGRIFMRIRRLSSFVAARNIRAAMNK